MNDISANMGGAKSGHEVPSKKSQWTLLTISLCVLFVVTLWIDLQPVRHYRAIKSRVIALVPLGTDIDVAERILADAGLQSYGKDFATVDKDFYWLNVKVHNARRSVVADLLMWLRIYLYHDVVVIEARLDNKVRRIF